MRQRNITNVAHAAREKKVSYHRLLRRFKGIPSKSEVGGRNKRLSEAQELALHSTLKGYERAGLPARPRMIRGIANDFLNTINQHAVDDEEKEDEDQVSYTSEDPETL